jgi:AcrR family transcriptional regulator
MARTIKENEYIEKRDEILAAAQRLVFTKGYERMSIQDILGDLRISSGAFYHYFDSKAAVLEALIERMQEEGEKPLFSIFNDPGLTAVEKLQHYFVTLDNLRAANMKVVVDLLRIWYTDDNAIVRQKVDTVTIKQRQLPLAEIIRQGIREGVFTVSHPDQAAEIILSLLQGMGKTHAMILLSFKHASDEQSCSEAIVAVHAAYMDTIEQILSAPPGSFYRTDVEAVKVWLTALRSNI